MDKKDKKLDVDSLNELIRTSNKLLRFGFIIIIIALIVLTLSVLRTLKIFATLKELLIVISPLFIGLVIAWLFDPVVKFLTNKKVPRVLACILVYIVFFGLLTALLIILTPPFVEQIKDFVSTIPSLFSDFKEFVNDTLNNLNSGNGLDFTGIKIQIVNALENTSASLTTNLPDLFMNLVKSLVSGGMFIIIGIMVGFYMLYDYDKMNRGIVRMLPKKWQGNARELGKRINSSLRSYVTGVLLVMLLVFITQAIGLTIVGIKAPLIFALFCALTDIIPYFGPYIGAIPAVIVAFTMSPVTGIFCIISIVIVQLLENNFYQPLIMGHTMKLHPVTIMISLLIFEHFFGIIGMILATPIVATLKVVITFINEKIDIIGLIKGKKRLNNDN